MKCIDFDSHFNKYVQRWMTENRSKYKNVDEMEAQMPDVYLKWINLPAEWLDGQTPALYFEQYDDAAMLCKWMLKYIRSSIALPDQLMERIAALGEAAVEPLMEIAFDREQSDEARMSALGTLEQIQSPRPIMKLIELIVHARGEESEMSNLASEMLAALDCANIADSEKSLLETLSMEAILAADPDFIFLVEQSADPDDARRMLEKTLFADPAWQTLTAVREGRCFVMDPALYNLKPNARWGEAYEALADILY